MSRAVKCWIDQWGWAWAVNRHDRSAPAVAVPLDLMARLLCVVADMEVTDAERADLERLCREMREEVGHG